MSGWHSPLGYADGHSEEGHFGNRLFVLLTGKLVQSHLENFLWEERQLNFRIYTLSSG